MPPGTALTQPQGHSHKATSQSNRTQRYPVHPSTLHSYRVEDSMKKCLSSSSGLPHMHHAVDMASVTVAFLQPKGKI